MSEWTHSICERCWLRQHGGRVPTSLRDEHRLLESCCFCDRKHESGIYIRHDPKDPALKCGGEHEDEASAG